MSVYSSSPDLPLLSEALRRGWVAFRQNALGMAVIIGLGLLILGGYALVPAVQVHLDQLAAWKVSLGWVYPAVSLALVGGVLPGAIMAIRDRRWPGWRILPVIVIYWPYRGIEIDLLYRSLGWLLGTDNDLGTVSLKVVLDMAIYVPFWALPLYLLMAGWQQGEDPRTLLSQPSFWRERSMPGVLVNWLLWIPAVGIIYALPPGLQLPVQNLFIVLWILIVDVLAQRQPSCPPPPETSSCPAIP